ncbi:hypothetical protein DENSPDRAFT_928971 [Dentipellis sp. KUC8613]|nr:hypothetical protein DENSPDRAFT_928971 [Dentipellis sp. KUC8613]
MKLFITFFSLVVLGITVVTAACAGDPALATRQVNASEPVEVQSVGDWKALGCYNDSLTDHTLGAQLNVTNTTVEACTGACYNAGFTLAGLESGSGCFCNNEFTNSAAPVALGNCNISCGGNVTELCGGPSFLNVYNYTGNFSAVSPPVAQLELHNTGAYNADLRIVYNGTTSNPLCGPVSSSSSCTVNLTKTHLLTEGEEFRVKVDMNAGKNTTLNTVLTYSSTVPDCTADLNSSGTVQNPWVAFGGFSGCSNNSE